MQIPSWYHAIYGLGQPRTAQVMKHWYPFGGVWYFNGTRMEGGLSKLITGGTVEGATTSW